MLAQFHIETLPGGYPEGFWCQSIFPVTMRPAVVEFLHNPPVRVSFAAFSVCAEPVGFVDVSTCGQEEEEEGGEGDCRGGRRRHGRDDSGR